MDDEASIPDLALPQAIQEIAANRFLNLLAKKLSPNTWHVLAEEFGK